MTFTVTRTGTSEVPIAFTWATANGTAVAGQDYTAVVGGTVMFPAGTDGTQTFTVKISNDDRGGKRDAVRQSDAAGPKPGLGGFRSRRPRPPFWPMTPTPLRLAT